MFRPSDIIIGAFVDRLGADYTSVFGTGRLAHRDTLTQVARMSLARIACTNALYHDLEHTILATQVGEDILRGKMVVDGNVTSEDWVHFVSSLLCFAVGFVRGTCPGDSGDRCVIDETGRTFALPRGATDGRLWPHFTDRSKIFVRHYFRDHPILNWQVLAANIEYSRYPPPVDRNKDVASYPGLLRAAQIIGAVADPNFMLKIRPLMIEVNEAGLQDQFGFSTVAEFKIGYPAYFWKVLHPLIPRALELLGYTGEGRAWLSNLHAHVLLKEHSLTIG